MPHCARIGTNSCGTVPRRAGGDAHAPLLAGRPRSPACSRRTGPGGDRRRGLGLHCSRADAAERRPGRSLARGRAGALLARLAPRARAHATRRAADPDGRDTRRARGCTPAASRRPPHAQDLGALAGLPLAVALRAGRQRPAGGRARRLLDRRRAWQPRLARPDRRPGPRRDRADAAREAHRSRSHARAHGQGTAPAGTRAGGVAVDARARAVPLGARLLPGDARQPAEAQRRRRSPRTSSRRSPSRRRRARSPPSCRRNRRRRSRSRPAASH